MSERLCNQLLKRGWKKDDSCFDFQKKKKREKKEKKRKPFTKVAFTVQFPLIGPVVNVFPLNPPLHPLTLPILLPPDSVTVKVMVCPSSATWGADGEIDPPPSALGVTIQTGTRRRRTKESKKEKKEKKLETKSKSKNVGATSNN